MTEILQNKTIENVDFTNQSLEQAEKNMSLLTEKSVNTLSEAKEQAKGSVKFAEICSQNSEKFTKATSIFDKYLSNPTV
jgi:hypothetical protein